MTNPTTTHATNEQLEALTTDHGLLSDRQDSETQKLIMLIKTGGLLEHEFLWTSMILILESILQVN